MLPWETRRTRRNGRGGAGRLPDRLCLERLEERELLAYTPLGYSLPDLTISGYTSSVASWGGPLTVTLDVQNLGASTLIEPTMLLPGATSHADSSPTTVAVIASRGPHPGAKGAVQVASIAVPSIKQNDFVQFTQTLTLPNRPAGLPGNGGKVYVTFKINSTGASPESDTTNNKSSGHLLKIRAPLPDLVVTALDVPPVMQPGDTIQPNVRIANLGPADTNLQGPVLVELVASTTPKFNSGSSVISTFSVPNIPGTSAVSSGSQLSGDANLDPQTNIDTIRFNPVTLPVSPKVYYIGVVVDPSKSIRQIHVIGRVQTGNALKLPQRVGPKTSGLPPAGVLYAGGGTNNLPFPYPPNITPSGTTTTLPQTGVKLS